MPKTQSVRGRSLRHTHCAISHLWPRQSHLADEHAAGFDTTDVATAQLNAEAQTSEGLLTPGSAPGLDKLYRFRYFIVFVSRTAVLRECVF